MISRLKFVAPKVNLLGASVTALLLVALTTTAASGPKRSAGQIRLSRHTSRHYRVHTNLTRSELSVLTDHMDKVFDQYDRRFSLFGNRRNERMDLYLFRTQHEYETFLLQQNIGASNTGGIFFVRPNIRGLATWTAEKPRSRTLAVLQHEGFHQFAFETIGHKLPIWANEGLAQYFEDAIIVRNRMVLGQRNDRRITSVRTAMLEGREIDFDRMLNMTSAQWQQTVARGGVQSSLMYDQAWSMAYYMIRPNEHRRDAFVQYLLKISKGRDPNEAFEKAFGQSTAAFEQGWRKFALTMEPDLLNTAVTRMEFLGQGLIMLNKHGKHYPSTLSALRSKLKKMRFQLTVISHGIQHRYSATDAENFEFRRPNGTRGQFRLHGSQDPTIPPTITAPGLNPRPTLVWSWDAKGNLVQDVTYR